MQFNQLVKFDFENHPHYFAFTVYTVKMLKGE